MTYTQQSFDAAMSKIRKRMPRIDREALYGEFAEQMVPGSRFFSELRDRAAYVYITGTYPSHLRSQYLGALRQITTPYKKPSSLDGRLGHVLLLENAVRDLSIEAHPMVRQVRERISQGYLIQQSRGTGTRRNYSKVFMFPHFDTDVAMRVTVRADGAEKTGW